jgi:hypothetical protein
MLNAKAKEKNPRDTGRRLSTPYCNSSHNSLEWEYIGKWPIEDLPKIYTQDRWRTLNCPVRQASFTRKLQPHLDKPEQEPSKQMKDSLNPRLVGNLDAYKKSIEDWLKRPTQDPKGHTLMSERLICTRKFPCTLNDNQCDFNWKWKLFSKDLKNVEIWGSGKHCIDENAEQQNPNADDADKMSDSKFEKYTTYFGTPIPLEMKKYIGEAALIGKTPTKILEDLPMKFNDPAWETLFQTISAEKIGNIREYSLKKLLGGLTEIQHVQKFVKEADRSKFAIYPRKDQAEGICDEKPFCIVVAHMNLLQAMAHHGADVVGFDGVYKWSILGYAVWLIVFRHRTAKNGFVAGIAISNKDDSDQAYNYVDFIQNEVNAILESTFKAPKPTKPLIEAEHSALSKDAWVKSEVKPLWCINVFR